MLQVAGYLDTDLDDAHETPGDEPGAYEVEVERLDPALHAWLVRGTVAAGET
jgi:hypothetical protein